MNFKKAHKMIAAVLVALLALTAVVPAFAQTQKKMNIVEIAVSNPDFSTLVAAVVKADLVDALDGPRRITVFAPTNAAFDELATQLGYDNGMELVDSLTAEQLTPILLHHVTNGKRPAYTLFPRNNVRMLTKERVRTLVVDGVPTIDGQPVLAANIRASNGIIHVIGGVMLPDGH